VEQVAHLGSGLRWCCPPPGCTDGHGQQQRGQFVAGPEIGENEGVLKVIEGMAAIPQRSTRLDQFGLAATAFLGKSQSPAHSFFSHRHGATEFSRLLVSFTIGKITRLKGLVAVDQIVEDGTWGPSLDGHPIPAGGIEERRSAIGALKGVQGPPPDALAAASDRPRSPGKARTAEQAVRNDDGQRQGQAQGKGTGAIQADDRVRGRCRAAQF